MTDKCTVHVAHFRNRFDPKLETCYVSRDFQEHEYIIDYMRYKGFNHVPDPLKPYREGPTICPCCHKPLEQEDRHQ